MHSRQKTLLLNSPERILPLAAHPLTAKEVEKSNEGKFFWNG